MVFGFGKRASALTAAIKAREAKARARTRRGRRGGRRVGVGTREGRVEERSGPGITEARVTVATDGR